MTTALADLSLLDGRYRLAEVLGTGGAAVVRRARDERLNRDVAVKLFHPGTADEQRCMGELSLMSSLAHPALVRMYDAGQTTETNGARSAYLVMEYLPGPTLHRALATGALGKARIAAIGADLAAALAYIHSRGVVHRDVKPANVLLSPDEDGVTAKLADFGIARMLDGTRVTAAGTTVGTANYLSPEQARGAEVGSPSDVYSLGLVLLEALTGHIVYPGVGITAALARLSREPAIPIDLGPAWCTLLRAMLDSDPLARPDAAEVRRALRGVEVAADPDAATATLVPARSTALLPVGHLTPQDPTSPAAHPTGAHRRGAGRTLVAMLALGTAAIVGVLAVVLIAGASQSPSAPNDASVSAPASAGRPTQVAAPAGAALSRGAASVPTEAAPVSTVGHTSVTVTSAPSHRIGAPAPGPAPGAGPAAGPDHGQPPGPGPGPGKAKKGHGHGGK